MAMNMQVVDVLAHNLANAATTGYKRREPVMQSFGDVLVELTGGGAATGSTGTTGTGVRLAEIARNEKAGALRKTDGRLDVALPIGGQYFVTQRADGTRLFTRDGQFYVNQQRQLVTGTGEVVLGADLGDITFRDEFRDIKIREDGTIVTNEGEVGRLLVVAPSPNQLLGFPQAAGLLTPAEGATVRQGYLESSNVNIVTEMVSLVEANRSFGFEQKIVSAHDQMLQKAANDVGRVQ